MLNFIRERAQGWIAWVIVGLLIIPFALWGINEYFGGGGRQVVATVNGTDIEQREFQQAFFEQRNRMQQMLGDQYDSALFDRQIRQRVVNDLVDRELLRQYATDADFRVSDETVAATISNIDEFREDGAFSTGLYQRVLQIQGMSAAGFENRVKQTLLVRQLPDGLANTAFVTDAEVNELIRLQEQTRDIRTLRVPVSQYRDESVATDEAIQAFYEANQERYMAPEQVRVEYIDLDSKKLATDTVPDEQTLRDLYESRASQFQVPEERQARHILIELGENADEAAVKAATDKANELLARVKAGESFADLAKEYSDDPGSAAQGGDLGYFNRGIMEPAFEETVFTLEPGEVSEVVRTPFGLHIIKLEAIREAKGKGFAEVKTELLQDYQQEQAIEKYFGLAERLTNLAFEIPDSLQEVAEQLGLELKQSAFFSRAGGDGLFANPAVVQAAFKDDVLNQGFNSEPVDIGDNHVVVLRLQEHRPAAQKTLQEVREQVRNQLIANAAQQAAAEAGETALKRLQAGEDAQTVAQSLNQKWESVADVRRDGDVIDPAVAREAFRLVLPETVPPETGRAVGSASLASGDVVLIELNAVKPGDPSAQEAAQRESLKRRLASEKANIAQQYLIESLRSEAKITINLEEL